MEVYACEDDDQDMLSITDWAEGEYKIACFNSDDEVNVILSKERVEQLIGDLKELIK